MDENDINGREERGRFLSVENSSHGVSEGMKCMNCTKRCVFGGEGRGKEERLEALHSS